MFATGFQASFWPEVAVMRTRRFCQTEPVVRTYREIILSKRNQEWFPRPASASLHCAPCKGRTSKAWLTLARRATTQTLQLARNMNLLTMLVALEYRMRQEDPQTCPDIAKSAIDTDET
jgi:hypothetical protein